ncbi:hypothetical protein PENTCL1PPCAC_26324, partial [Pristionchus entomophagus]
GIDGHLNHGNIHSRPILQISSVSLLLWTSIRSTLICIADSSRSGFELLGDLVHHQNVVIDIIVEFSGKSH